MSDRSSDTSDSSVVPDAADNRDWVYGFHPVAQALAATPEKVRRVLVLQGRRDKRIGEIVDQAAAAGVRVEPVDGRTLNRVAKGSHQGVAAQCDAVTLAGEAEFEARFPSFDNPLILVLEGVQDPRNLGACLRSAEAAGVDAVLLPKRRTAPLSSTVAKAASGALANLFLVGVSNLARRLAWLKDEGVWLVGADDAAQASFTTVDLAVPVAIVLGAEGGGLHRLTKESCDFLASIPMSGAVSSLNVSVATGIFLFEVRRQRQ